MNIGKRGFAISLFAGAVCARAVAIGIRSAASAIPRVAMRARGVGSSNSTRGIGNPSHWNRKAARSIQKVARRSGAGRAWHSDCHAWRSLSSWAAFRIVRVASPFLRAARESSPHGTGDVMHGIRNAALGAIHTHAPHSRSFAPQSRSFARKFFSFAREWRTPGVVFGRRFMAMGNTRHGIGNATRGVPLDRARQ